MKVNLFKTKFIAAVITAFCLLLITNLYSQTTLSQVITTPGAGTFTVPVGVTSITVEVWGGGGRGGSITTVGQGGGGGGGAYSRKVMSVTPGTIYSYQVGFGGRGSNVNGGDSWFGSTATVLAKGGSGGIDDKTNAGQGGIAVAFGDVRYKGGNGYPALPPYTGGGGSSAGTSHDGYHAQGISGATAPVGGGNGGDGGVGDANGSDGKSPGGGGGGASKKTSTGSSQLGGNGGDGQLKISWIGCPTLTSEISGTNSICNGNSTNLRVAINGGTGPYTVVYSGGTITNYTSGSNIPVNPSSSTTYTLTSVTDSKGCPANVSGTATITVNPILTPSVTLSQTSGSGSNCFGAPLTFTATASGYGSGNVTYDFLVDGASVQRTTSPVYTTSSLPPGLHTVTCNITVSGGTCLTTTTATTNTGITITVLNTPPGVDAGEAATITKTSAVITGTITSIGCTPVTSYGVEYSTTNGFTEGSGTRVQGTNMADNNFSILLSNLTQGTNYYYRTYAANNGGTSYSEQHSFITSAESGTSVTVSPVKGTYGETTTLSATLTSGDIGVEGKTITFAINGVPAGTAITDASGVATIPEVSLAGNNAGTYSDAVSASFAGDAGYLSSNSAATLVVDKAASSIRINVDDTYIYNGTAQGPSSVMHTGSGGDISYTYSGTTYSGLSYGPTNALPVMAGVYHVTAFLAGDNNYTGAIDSKDFAINKAPSTTVITITGDPFTFTGYAITPATVQVTGAGDLNVSPTPVYTANVNVGTATVSYTYAGDDNHEGSTANATFEIGKATPTVDVSIEGPYTYNGAAQGPTSATNSGTGTSYTFTYAGINGTVYGPSAAAPSAAGAYTVTASVSASPDGNYNAAASEAKAFSIGKGTPLVHVTIGGPYTYDGAVKSVSSATVTGADNTPLGTATVIYKKEGTELTPLNAATYEVYASFAGDNNYNPVTVYSGSLVIGKAPTVTAVTATGGSYTGLAIGAAARITGDGNLNEAVTVVYTGVAPTEYLASTTAPINAGTYSATATYAGSANYLGSADTKSFTINKATPTIGITLSPTYTYDGAVKAVQDATVLGVNNTILGNATVLYKQGTAAVTPINAGEYTVYASFAGNDNYEAATDNTKTLRINKAIPTVSATAATDLVFNGTRKEGGGTATGVGGINDVLSPAVTLSYSGTGETVYPESTTAPVNAGTYTVTASFAGNSNYEGATSPATGFTITKATPTVTPQVGTYMYNGSPQGPASATNSGTGTSYTFEYVGVNGTSYAASPTPPVSAGDYTITATVAATADGNFNGASSAATPFSIGKASTTTTVAINGGPFTYTGLPQTPATVTVSGPGSLHLQPAALYTNNINAGIATASYKFEGDNNYKPSSDSKTFEIKKADASIEVTPYAATYDGHSYTASGTAKGVDGELLAGLDLGATMHTAAGRYNDTYTFTDLTGNYTNATGNLVNEVHKRPITVTPGASLGKTYGEQDPELSYTASEDLLAGNTFTGSLHRSPGEDVGQYVYDLGTLNAGSNYDITLVTSSLPGMTVSAVSEHKFEIRQRDLTVTALGINKEYDGTTDATVKLSSGTLPGDALSFAYTAANFDDPAAGDNKAVQVSGISISGPKAGNYRLLSTTASTTASITKASSKTALITSAGTVRYMDDLTMTATVVPSNKASALSGSVAFFIGDQSYGTATVVPVPGSTTGAVQATLIRQVANLPSDYRVKAVFTSGNPNYAGNEEAGNLTVLQRDASPGKPNQFYTGDVFAWTTGPNASKGTVTLRALLRDVEAPIGDVRSAKVTFYYKSGNTLTPIPGAKELPVGLVDINDGSLGAATAIVQFDLGTQNAQSYDVTVGISGAYKNNPGEVVSQAVVTVSKPITGGYICGGSDLKNTNSAGYIKGHTGLDTHYEFDIQYTNKGTNPKGKSRITVYSWYKPDGTLDARLHKYIIASNAIASLAVKPGGTGATSIFSSKASLYEEFDDGTPSLSIDGGATFQMEVFQDGCKQQIDITLYRKAGGIWFSNNWDAANAKSVLQDVCTGSTVYVAGATGCNLVAASRTSNAVTTADRNPLAALFSVTAYPNPSATAFHLQVSTGNTQDPIRLRVVDLLGRTVETRNVAPNTTLQLGGGYKAGIYLVELSQGSTRQGLKLVKQ